MPAIKRMSTIARDVPTRTRDIYIRVHCFKLEQIWCWFFFIKVEKLYSFS